MNVLFSPVVKPPPASIPNTVFLCGLPDNPAGTSATYTESVSTKQSERPFKLEAPPPPPDCKVIRPVPELNVKTSPSEAPDCNPGILNAVIFASPKVISFETPPALAATSIQ